MKKADLQNLINDMDDDTEIFFFVSPAVIKYPSSSDPSKIAPELFDAEGYAPAIVSIVKLNNHNKYVILGADCEEIPLGDFLSIINTDKSFTEKTL